jgi:hypothetical protein
MSDFAITSTENATRLGLSAPANKSTHVVDKSIPELLFSTNSVQRAGAFEAAKEDEAAALVRAKRLHEEAALVEKEAARAAERAEQVRVLEDVYYARQRMGESSGLAALGAVAAIGVREGLGTQPGYGVAAVYALAGAAIVATMAHKYPRAATAVAASLIALGGKLALDANAQTGLAVR